MHVPSVHIAKERVRSLVTSDRVDCTPDMLEKMSIDIYLTLSKYLELEPDKFDVNITRSDIHIKYTGEKY